MSSENAIKKIMKTEIPKNIANIVQNKKRIERVLGTMKTDGNTEKYYKDYKKSITNLRKNIKTITKAKPSDTQMEALMKIEDFMEGKDVREQGGKYGKKGNAFVDKDTNQAFSEEDIKFSFIDLTVKGIQSSKFNNINNPAFSRLKDSFEKRAGANVGKEELDIFKEDVDKRLKKDLEDPLEPGKKAPTKAEKKLEKFLDEDEKKQQEASPGGEAKKEEEAVQAPSKAPPAFSKAFEEAPAPSKSPPTEEFEEKENAPAPTPAEEEEGIGAETKEGEEVPLEDEAEKDNTKEGEHTIPNEPGETPNTTEEQPQTEAPTTDAPTTQPETIAELQKDMPGSVPEIDIVDASRDGGAPLSQQTVSQIVNNQEATEDKQRAKATIGRLKEEIKALHLLYDNNIKQFRENPHKKDRDDALASNDIEKVRAHHKSMERAVRDYFKSGSADDLKVGVIVPIDQYLSQYFNSNTAPATTIPKIQNEAVSRVAHAGAQLVAKGEDRFNRAIAQNTFYQRGGMSSFKMKAVANHKIRIGGQSRVGDVEDPKPRVDAPLDQYLRRPLKLKSSLKIKS
tara:strand:+ start:1445 stop:3142 length:1698 start_codon:yes stop_codon:yes gene_type:complete